MALRKGRRRSQTNTGVFRRLMGDLSGAADTGQSLQQQQCSAGFGVMHAAAVAAAAL